MNYTQAVEQYGSVRAAARALGVARSTVQDAVRLRKAKEEPEHRLSFPEIPDAREPTDRLIQRRTEHYERQRAHKQAATWQRVKVRDNKPIGLVLMGDPHLDDDGCNWPQVLHDVKLMRETDGMYAVNAGDTTNNWVGRLARLFGNQETSQTSARQLAEWLLLHAGIRWAAVLLGNHDSWNEGGEIIQRMASLAKVQIPVHDWAAKVEFVFPNGATCRMNAAHDFKGKSIYSTTHGPLREAIWMQDGAHLLVAGHIHFGGLQQIEIPGGHNPWLVRVSGYKDFDKYALVNGFHEGQRFRSAVAIIDPDAPPEDRVTMYGSVAQGAKALKALRAVYKTPRKSKTKAPKKRKPSKKMAKKARRPAKRKRPASTRKSSRPSA